MFQNKKIPGWVFITISALLTFLAFLPRPLNLIAFFSLVPVFYVLEKDGFINAFEKGYLWGIIFNLGIIHWLALNQGTEWYWALLSMIASVFFLSIGYGFIFFLIAYIARRFNSKIALLSTPIIWTAIEFIRSLGGMGFTWNNLAYSQTEALHFIQFITFTGPLGISCWVVCVNIALYLLLTEGLKSKAKTQKYAVIIGLMFIIPGVFSIISLQQSKKFTASKKPVRVGVVQPNVDPTEKWVKGALNENIQNLLNLTDSLESASPDLIVWPETATPTYLRRNYKNTLGIIYSHMRRNDVYLLTGTPDFTQDNVNGYSYYNGAFFIDPYKRRFNYHHKVKLVPFGEYIPLATFFPELNRLNLGQGNFLAGDSVKVFQMPLKKVDNSLTFKDDTLNFSVAICYESAFPKIIQQGIKQGSEMLIVITNDAWYGFSIAPYLHKEIARLRAVENRIPVIRSANTGISCAFDAFGKELDRIDFEEKGVFSVDVRQGTGKTFYAKTGNWPGWISVILIMIIIIYGYFRSTPNETL